MINQDAIDEMVQYFLSRKGILAVKRVLHHDVKRISKATGGKIFTEGIWIHNW